MIYGEKFLNLNQSISFDQLQNIIEFELDNINNLLVETFIINEAGFGEIIKNAFENIGNIILKLIHFLKDKFLLFLNKIGSFFKKIINSIKNKNSNEYKISGISNDEINNIDNLTKNISNKNDIQKEESDDNGLSITIKTFSNDYDKTVNNYISHYRGKLQKTNYIFDAPMSFDYTDDEEYQDIHKKLSFNISVSDKDLNEDINAFEVFFNDKSKCFDENTENIIDSDDFDKVNGLFYNADQFFKEQSNSINNIINNLKILKQNIDNCLGSNSDINKELEKRKEADPNGYRRGMDILKTVFEFMTKYYKGQLRICNFIISQSSSACSFNTNQSLKFLRHFNN